MRDFLLEKCKLFVWRKSTKLGPNLLEVLDLVVLDQDLHLFAGYVPHHQVASLAV